MTSHFAGITNAVRVFADDSLVAEPGTRFSQSTLGYMLLGCAVEGASGISYTA